MLNWIIWNETVLTLILYVAQSTGTVEYTYSNAGALGNAEHPFIAIAPRSTLARNSGSINGLNRTYCILTLNWIVWIRTVWLNWIARNRNVLTIKLCTYAKLNCLK